MNLHFFTAPFYFAFIWFRVQGSGLRWRLRRLFLEDGILVSQPSPRGEGAPQGRIGHRRYESVRRNAYQAGDLRQQPSACFFVNGAARKWHLSHQSREVLNP